MGGEEPTQSPPPRVPLAEAVRLSGKTESYLRRLLRQGRLDGINDGRRWLVDVASLKQWKAPEVQAEPTDAPQELEQLRGRVDDLDTLHRLAVADAHSAEIARLEADVAARAEENARLTRDVQRLEHELTEALDALQALAARWAGTHPRPQ